ncbi:MAP7 domain-containing protein 1 isoform X2 [Penaeus vannamei]|uniref:MAP7 domain-containing protein 1 isoform X2 n=1 Tax=Penaeus vannamei TaxID=6689 RepID=UPI00387F55BA
MRVSPAFIPVGVGVWAVGDGRAFGFLCVVWGALTATAAAAGDKSAQDHSCNFHNASLTLDPASDKGYSFVRTLTKGATACIYVFDCLDEDRANLDVCERLDTNTLKGENVEGKNFKGDWQRLHFERFEVSERSIAVLVVGDFLRVFETKNNPVLRINEPKGMEFATDCKDSLTNVCLSCEQPAEAPPDVATTEPTPGGDSVWLPVAVALLVLLVIVALVSVAVCFRLRRRASSQEPEALRQSSACAQPALSSSPSPSLAEGKSPLGQRYSTLLASDAVAVPNGRSKGGGGGHRSQASRDLSGLPDLAPPPLPSTSPPSLPHHPDGASPPTEAADVRRTLEWQDNACHGDAKDPQEAPWSGADDGEGDYADPKELETPPWLRIQGAADDEDHDYADPRELEKPAWLLAQDDDEDHDYDYIDRDALRILLGKDKEEAQRRSLAAEEGRLSSHDSENSLYEEMKALEAARETSALEERRRRERQQREEQEQQKQEIQEGKQEQQGDEEEKRQQKTVEEQEQNEQMKDSEQEILESVKL